MQMRGENKGRKSAVGVRIKHKILNLLGSNLHVKTSINQQLVARMERSTLSSFGPLYSIPFYSPLLS